MKIRKVSLIKRAAKLEDLRDKIEKNLSPGEKLVDALKKDVKYQRLLKIIDNN